MDLKDDATALQVTAELWSWLADYPGKHKSDWPGWEFNGGTIETCIASCPTCANRMLNNRSCSECLLVEAWGKTDYQCGCVGWNSPYTKYNSTDVSAIRRKYATIIKDACIVKLKNLHKPDKLHFCLDRDSVSENKRIRLSLVDYIDYISLVAHLDDGSDHANNLLMILPSGRITRCACVSKHYGFKLDNLGRVKLNSEV